MLMEQEIHPTRLQYIIEHRVTNDVCFHDSPRDFFVNPEKISTLLGLRIYLSAMECNVALRGYKTRNPKRFFIASQYLGDFDEINASKWYHQNFNLNNSKGIDDALEFQKKSYQKFFEEKLDAA
jgi:hypothetical protein